MPCKECVAQSVHYGMVVATRVEEDGRTTVRLATCKGVEEASCSATVKTGQLLAYRQHEQLGSRLELPIRPLDSSFKNLQIFDGGSTFVLVFRRQFPKLRKFGRPGTRLGMDHPVLFKILLTQPEVIVGNRDYLVAAACYSPADAPSVPFTALAFRMVTEREFHKFDFRLLNDAEGGRRCDEMFRHFTADFAAHPERLAALVAPAVAGTSGAGPSGVNRTSGTAARDARQPAARPRPSTSQEAAERADDEDEEDEETGIRFVQHRARPPLPAHRPAAEPPRRARQPPPMAPIRDLRATVDRIDEQFINNPRIQFEDPVERRYLTFDHAPLQPAAQPPVAPPAVANRPGARRVPPPRPPPPRLTPARAPEETAARTTSPAAQNDPNERSNDPPAPPAAPTPNLIDFSQEVQPLQLPAEIQPEAAVEVAEERPPSGDEQEASERSPTPRLPSTPPPSLEDAREASVEQEKQSEEERPESPDAPRLLPPDLRAEAREAVRGMTPAQIYAAITKDQLCGLLYVVWSTGFDVLQRAPEASQQSARLFGAALAGGSGQAAGQNTRAEARANSPNGHERERLGRLQASAPPRRADGTRPPFSRPFERYRSRLLENFEDEHADSLQ